MKVNNDIEANIVAWEVSKSPISYAKEVGHTIIHFSEAGLPVYIEVLQANKFIDKNEGSYQQAPEALKQLCRIEKVKVVDVKPDCYIVKVGKKNRVVSKIICADAKLGDLVSVHYGYAVEKLVRN